MADAQSDSLGGNTDMIALQILYTLFASTAQL